MHIGDNGLWNTGALHMLVPLAADYHSSSIVIRVAYVYTKLNTALMVHLLIYQFNYLNLTLGDLGKYKLMKIILKMLNSNFNNHI